MRPGRKSARRNAGLRENGYEKYSKVKLEFDNLNTAIIHPRLYAFDPWVQFLHGKTYLNIPGVYAYSVDDAVGNIQAAEARGVHHRHWQPDAPETSAAGGAANQYCARICVNGYGQICEL
jgi:hypothetical protein